MIENPSPVVELSEAAVTLAGRRVLDGITFSIAPGERIGLIGANGSGKSSLLNALCGYYPISDGRIEITGVDIHRRTPSKVTRLGVGRSFQAVGAFEDLTVADFLMVGTDVAWGTSSWWSLITAPHVRRAERKHRANIVRLAELAGIADSLNRKLRHCPYGLRKIADVVRAVSCEPSLLLLDEPISGVGSMGVPAMKRFIEEYADRSGAALLMVDHDVGFVSSICDRLVALSAGRVIADGPKDEVLSDPAVVRTFLGTDVAVQ
jgi:branched-chain amino acid transport system ATP-binding protein